MKISPWQLKIKALYMHSTNYLKLQDNAVKTIIIIAFNLRHFFYSPVKN